jgi:hypothetical protein
MFNCDCKELLDRGITIQEAEIHINSEIIRREILHEELKHKEVLSDQEIELRDNVLPTEIGCLKICRENFQKKWFKL